MLSIALYSYTILSIVSCRPEVDAKFYGESIDAEDLLFRNMQPRPIAAQPLYDALNAATNLEVPDIGFKPSHLLNRVKK